MFSMISKVLLMAGIGSRFQDDSKRVLNQFLENSMDRVLFLLDLLVVRLLVSLGRRVRGRVADSKWLSWPLVKLVHAVYRHGFVSAQDRRIGFSQRSAFAFMCHDQQCLGRSVHARFRRGMLAHDTLWLLSCFVRSSHSLLHSLTLISLRTELHARFASIEAPLPEQ